jgi:hypothetical protein
MLDYKFKDRILIKRIKKNDSNTNAKVADVSELEEIKKDFLNRIQNSNVEKGVIQLTTKVGGSPEDIGVEAPAPAAEPEPEAFPPAGEIGSAQQIVMQQGWTGFGGASQKPKISPKVLDKAIKNIEVARNTPTSSGRIRNIRRFCLTPDFSEILKMMLDDEDEEKNSVYHGIQPGITAELTLQGISGIRTFAYFLIENLPEPYSPKNIVFIVQDVQHQISNGNWETIIRAGVFPMRGSLAERIRAQRATGVI